MSVTVTDDDGAVDRDELVVAVSNEAPVVQPVVAPLKPQQVGTQVVASAQFSDTGTVDVHTATVDWGDGSSARPPSPRTAAPAKPARATPTPSPASIA